MKIPTIDPATLYSTNKTDPPASPATGNNKDKEALKKSCQDFEAIFIQSMLKEMRKTIPESTLFSKSSGQKMYEDMLDSEIASHTAKNQSLGFAEDMYNQLEKLLPTNQKKQ